MPIYEYKCAGCGDHFENMQKVSEERLKSCKKCGGNLEKQWSLSGFQFKGEGWYVTDYANKKTDTSDIPAKSEKTEKNTTSESTEKAEPASKPSNDSSSPSKKETVSKKE